MRVQTETAFLRQVILYDDTVERHLLEKAITRGEREARCLLRAVWLMGLLTALAVAGLCYCAVFLADFPKNMTWFGAQFMVKAFSALGLASLISLLAFVGLGTIYRREQNLRRQECRRLVAKLLESRLGKPINTSPRDCRVGAGNGAPLQVAAGHNGSPDQTELPHGAELPSRRAPATTPQSFSLLQIYSG